MPDEERHERRTPHTQARRLDRVRESPRVSRTGRPVRARVRRRVRRAVAALAARRRERCRARHRRSVRRGRSGPPGPRCPARADTDAVQCGHRGAVGDRGGPPSLRSPGRAERRHARRSARRVHAHPRRRRAVACERAARRRRPARRAHRRPKRSLPTGRASPRAPGAGRSRGLREAPPRRMARRAARWVAIRAAGDHAAPRRARHRGAGADHGRPPRRGRDREWHGQRKSAGHRPLVRVRGAPTRGQRGERIARTVIARAAASASRGDDARAVVRVRRDAARADAS
jgi:hypothetical protein